MLRKTYIFYLFFLIACCSIGFGQGPKQQDSVKTILRTLGQDTNRVKALLYLAKFYAEDQKKNMTEALEISEKLNYLDGKIFALSGLGSIIEAGADYNNALIYYYKACQLAEQKGEQQLIYMMYGQVFNAAVYLGEYPKALDIALKGLALAEQKNNITEMATQYNNIGFLYDRQDNYKKAKEYMYKYFALAEKIGNEGMLANACNNMADMHEKEKDYTSALEKLFKALDIYTAMDIRIRKKSPAANQMKQYIAVTYNNIANLYRSLGDNRKALGYSLKCLEAASKVSINKYDLSFFYITNGNLCTAIGEYGKARASLEKGLEIAQEINHKEDQKLAYLALSEMYAAKGDHKSAVKYHKEYTAVKKEMLNEKNTKQMTEMNAKYESVKKGNELLKKEVTLQTQLIEAQRKALLRNILFGCLMMIAVATTLIFRSTIRKRKANELILAQKLIIEDKNKEITDSIHYAKRIQKALLANRLVLSKYVPEHFIVYQPKDIVSGDFYWAHVTNGKLLICIADSTGHGVPGAFMSLLNISFLNEAVTEKNMESPEVILNSVRQSLINALSTDNDEASRDGMDCVLCSFDAVQNKLIYAASNNVFYIIRNDQLISSQVDKMPVGRSPREKQSFTGHEFELMHGDMVYLLTDGYADQFGGPKGKKFRYKQLEELMLANHKLPMEDQKRVFTDTINRWRGEIEQVDDILITGIRYSKV